MNRTEWWELFDANKGAMRQLVSDWHPASRNRSRKRPPITARAAEMACEVVRERIAESEAFDPLTKFDSAMHSRNDAELYTLLNEAWFGLPESASVRRLTGFHELCDLCSEYEF